MLVELTRAAVNLRGRIVLDDLTWRLDAGEHWAILGPNGAGKSTFLRLVRGDVALAAGERHYGVTDAGAIGARERIAYVSPERQERHARLALHLSSREVIASGIGNGEYPPEVIGDRLGARIIAVAGELGILPLLDRQTSALSHGQLRRVLIARALVADPAILLLDEYASGLDRASLADVIDLLERIAHRVTLVIAAHRERHVPSCIANRLHLDRGRIVDAPERREPRRIDVARVRALRRAPAREHETIVRLEGASVVIDGSTVLHDISWTLHSGEHWLVHGPNGAGKSTFARLIAAHAPARFGSRVERFGRIRLGNDTETKTRIALISDELQTAYDWHATVADVVASGLFASIGLFRDLDDAQRERLDDVLAAFDLERERERAYLGLSFGERRRVLLARAFVSDPDVIVVDEATEGLDPASRTGFLAAIDDLARRGVAIVYVTHDDDVPDAITHRLELDRGRIVRAGPREPRSA